MLNPIVIEFMLRLMQRYPARPGTRPAWEMRALAAYAWQLTRRYERRAAKEG